MTSSKTQASLIDRRRFLEYTWCGVGVSLSLALLPGHEILASPRFGDDPFTLGVASGDPTDDSIVLWTRLAPEPANPDALGHSFVPVRWRVATDSRMRHVVARGTAVAAPQLAHSVRETRFAFVTCQDWPSGYYIAYRDMLQNDLDLVFHLGDYTYEYAIEGTTGRGIVVPEGFGAETRDLRTYRLRHTLHKLDPDLQAAHAKFPFAVIWDDHEVANDYSGLAPEFASPSPEFTARRAAAYQAWYEHMPVRLKVALNPRPGLQIYRRLRYGALAEFTMLDDRQYRADNPCGDGESLRCDAALNGRYTFLGREQEQWVAKGFGRSSARWNIVAQQLLIAQLEHTTIRDNWFWNDAWDGYPRARQRLLEDVAGSRLQNPVFLTGDWHSTFVNDLKLDFNNPASRTIATEFVTPAITTGGDGTPCGPYYGPMIPFNPHIKYYEGDRRGYFKATLTPQRMRVDLRFMTTVESQAGVGYTEGSWVVHDGRAWRRPLFDRHADDTRADHNGFRMHIRTRSINPALAILELNGRLTAESGSALCDAVLAVLAEGGRHLILNLSGVRALDASGLGGLAATLRLVREVGGELKVVAGSAAINELLRRTHLSVALPAVASEAEAIASFETAKV